MSWVVTIALAVAAFALAVVVMGVARNLWTSLVAALAFGLAGYALQASPGLPAAPKSAQVESDELAVQIVELRRQMVGEEQRSRNALVLTADAYARKGQYVDAAELLSGATEDNPQDFDAWLALGNALSEHADGALTPASLYAYRKAAELGGGHPAPGYFLGVSLIQQGRMMEARQVWRDALAAAPDEAVGKAVLAESVLRLESALGIEPTDPAPVPDAGAEAGE